MRQLHRRDLAGARGQLDEAAWDAAWAAGTALGLAEALAAALALPPPAPSVQAG